MVVWSRVSMKPRLYKWIIYLHMKNESWDVFIAVKHYGLTLVFVYILNAPALDVFSHHYTFQALFDPICVVKHI